ncbi:MAG: hypothetical protein GX793_05500 [Bacteroidales bacterium]|jgi:hypothetical protein|nr:hypothetical protein [Bacteroidales bacterium]
MNIDWLKKNWIIVVLILGVAYYFFVYKKQNIEKVDDVVDDNPVIGSGGYVTYGRDVNSDPNEEPTSDVVGVKPAPFAITDIITLELIKEGFNKQPAISAFSQVDKQSLFSGKRHRR